MSNKRSLPQVLCVAAVAASFLLAGCKVVSIQADRDHRARQSQAFDAMAYVNRAWDDRILPKIQAVALPFPAYDRAVAANLEDAGAKYGRRASEGSPWTFVVQGEGVVTAIDRASGAGGVSLAVAGLTGTRTVMLQTGPVIVDTAIRDSLPFLNFNDFADQVVFANVGRALNHKALMEAAPTLRSLRVGDRVEFVGAANVSTVSAPLRITPIRLSRAAGNQG